jgi:hypothetical protein
LITTEIPVRDLTAEDLERVFNRMTVRRGKIDQPASAKDDPKRAAGVALCHAVR